MAVDVGSAVGYLDLDISGFLANLKSAQSEADAASRNIATKIGKNLSGVGKSLTTAGSTLTKSVTVPVVGLGAAVTKVTSDFDTSMSKVSAISGATGDDLEELRDKAKEMGASTKFSATEAADAFTYMAMAGWKTEDMLGGISGIMQLAAADGLDLATTSDIVTDALTAFGLSAKDAGPFADILAAAASNANTNVSLMGETFKYVAPVAGALGYSVEDTAEAIGLMANAGIKGSQAGTSLRNILTNLQGEIVIATDKLGEMKIATTNTDGSMRELGDILGDMRGVFSQLSESEQALWAETLVGKEAMSGLLAIMNAAPADIEKLNTAINEADGTAQRMADTMLNNFGGQLTLLKSALEGLAIEIGEILMPHLSNFVKKIQDLVTWFSSLSTEQKEQIVKWAGIVAAIGPVLTIVGKLVSGFGTLFTTFGKIPGAISKVTSGFKNAVNSVKNVGEAFKLAKAGWTGMASSTSKLGTALAGVSGPMLAVVAVIGVLIAAFATLWKNNEEFRTKITSIWNQIKDTFKVAVGRIKSILEQLEPVFNWLKKAFEAAVSVLGKIWRGFCDLLAPLFTGAFQIVADTLAAIFDVIFQIVQGIINLFSGDLEGAMENFGQVFVSIWDWVVNVFRSFGDTLLGIADAICEWFGTTWNDTWSSVKEFFGSVWDSVAGFFSSAWETMKNVVQVGIMSIVELLSAAAQLILLPFTFIWENCKDVILEAWEAIKKTVSNYLKKVSDNITKVWNAVKKAFESIWNPIKSFVTNVWNSMKSTISNTLNSIKTTISNVFNSVKTNISNVWNNIKSTLSSTINSIKSNISSGFNSAKSTVSSILDSIKSKFTSIWNNCTSIVSNAVSKLKSLMNFSWSLPRLKLPHISISGRFSLNPPSVPHFSIQWYKAAMANGMILNSPTIFGFDSKTGKFLGGGEAGSETVVGTKSLMKMIQSAVTQAVRSAMGEVAQSFTTLYQNFNSSSSQLMSILGQLLDATRGYTAAVETLGVGSVTGSTDYTLLAAMLADILRKAPIQPRVDVYMEDGDVYMDKERVGRTVAPVVSRVIVQGTS